MQKQSKGSWMIGVLVTARVSSTGGFFLYCTQNAVSARKVGTAQLQAWSVGRGDLVSSATGAGTVIASNQVSLALNGCGLFVELPVKVGDKVDAGAVMSWASTAPATQDR